MDAETSLRFIALFGVAVLWLEATLRITASVERRTQRRMGLLGLVVVGLLWPILLAIAVVTAIAQQPRSWDGGPDEPDT